MPKKSGGAQNLRRGDRVQITLNGCYRHYLDGLTGVVTCVLHHGVIVVLDNDPSLHQKVIAPAGRAGPSIPNGAQRQFQFHEVKKLDP
jgi:hypothetical protein